MEAEKRKALSMYLRDIRDPRRRQGRTYPLASILTMLTLAAVNGAARDTPSSTGNESATDWVGRKSSAVWDANDKWKKRWGSGWRIAWERRLAWTLRACVGVAVSCLRWAWFGQKVQLVLAQEEVKGEHVIEAALSKERGG